VKIESESKMLIITPFAIVEKKGLKKMVDIKITLCTNLLRKTGVAFNACCLMCN